MYNGQEVTWLEESIGSRVFHHEMNGTFLMGRIGYYIDGDTTMHVFRFKSDEDMKFYYGIWNPFSGVYHTGAYQEFPEHLVPERFKH